ncbi:hypothetical protein V8C86DRAFT_1825376, partial [Haematococcus lacustris]
VDLLKLGDPTTLPPTPCSAHSLPTGSDLRLDLHRWTNAHRRAPLVLSNVAILLPDLEAQAIREVAVGGSTRVNLWPDTLDLLCSQLAIHRLTRTSDVEVP